MSAGALEAASCVVPRSALLDSFVDGFDDAAGGEVPALAHTHLHRIAELLLAHALTMYNCFTRRKEVLPIPAHGVLWL